MTLYLGMDQELLVVDPDHPEDATAILKGTRIAALAVDPEIVHRDRDGLRTRAGEQDRHREFF